MTMWKSWAGKESRPRKFRSPAAAVRDPQVVGAGETVRLQHPAAPQADVYGPGLHVFSGSGTVSISLRPAIGEHNEQICCGLLGYSQDVRHRYPLSAAREEGGCDPAKFACVGLAIGSAVTHSILVCM